MARLLHRMIIYHQDFKQVKFIFKAWLIFILQEHEDSLGHASKDDNAEGLNETGDGDGSEIFNEDLLDEDDEDGDEERSWKRRTNDDD